MLYTSEQWTEWIYSGLWSGIKMLWEVIAPILIPMLIVGIVAVIIKKIIVNRAYNFFRITGNSRTKAKKKTKKVSDIIDMASAVNDVYDKSK